MVNVSKFCRLIALVCAVVAPSVFFAGGDEGRLLKSLVYNQTDATGAVLDSKPYHFIATVRNSVEDHSASVLVPASGSWSPSPFTVVDPSLLIGAHFVFDQSFSDQSSMDSAFPEGSYTLDITRNYASSTTEFQQAISFTGSSLPSEFPEITNSEWEGGHLVLHPVDAVIK